MEQKVSVSVTNLSTTGFTINFIPDDGIKYYCIYVPTSNFIRIIRRQSAARSSGSGS